MAGLWGMKGRVKVSAEYVRALPEGARVRVHGRDRFGYSTALDCWVVESGRYKKLAYTGLDGLTHTMGIGGRDGEGKYYSVAEVIEAGGESR